MPTSVPLDFSACEAEPIRLPGAIQGCGALMAVDAASGLCSYVSAELSSIFAQAIDPRALLGRPWTECVALLDLPKSCLEAPPHNKATFVFYLNSHHAVSRTVEVFSHASSGAHLWEFQLTDSTVPTAQADWESRIFEADVQTYQLAQAVTEEIQAQTGFARVMVYRFAADWSGEIIAESRQPNLIPFLGLHYPATDIPSQARQLYRENLLRAISSVGAPAIPLLALTSAPPLDLSQAILRAVSPYHLEYLSNMGVAATLTLSLMVDGELWGMIACHHDQPKAICAATRQRCSQIALRTASWISNNNAQLAARDAEWAQRDNQRLQEHFASASAQDLLGKLFFGAERIEHLLDADAAILSVGESLICIGDAPTPDWLHACINWLNSRPDPDQLYCENRLPAALPPPLERPESVCGILAARLSAGTDPVTLLLFRHEALRDVHWGGDPTRPAEVDAKQRLSPRKSFATWSETVRGQSLPWSARTVDRFKRILTHIRATAQAAELTAGARALTAELLGAAVTSGIIANRLIDNIEHCIAVLSHPADASSPQISLASVNFAALVGLPLLEIQKLPLSDLLKRLNLPHSVLNLGQHRLDAITPNQGSRALSISHRNFIRINTVLGDRHLTVLQIIDVTSDERLANALSASNRQLTDSIAQAHELAFKADAANRAKNQFLANMSHELRTPLNGVLGMATLLEQSGLTAEQKQYLDIIISSGRDLVQIIGDILDLAKIESGKVELEQIVFDPLKILAQQENAFSNQAQSKGLRLLFATDPNLPARLLGDPTKLAQILRNLIGNALKFTTRGGVTVLTNLVEVPASSCNSEPTVGLRFTVRDTGIGIPSDKLEHLFQEFTQVDASTTRQYGGTGLGLAIVKELVELMGGQLGVSSQPDRGSEFWFTLHLPLAPAAATNFTPAANTPAPALNPLTAAQRQSHILLVEDNDNNQQLIRHIIKKLGLTLTVADNGEEALRIVAATPSPFSLILMDIQMPGIDGYECTRRLRDAATGLAPADLPIIAMTANALAGDCQLCLDAGMNDYIAKPITTHSFAALLARWLPGA